MHLSAVFFLAAFGSLMFAASASGEGGSLFAAGVWGDTRPGLSAAPAPDGSAVRAASLFVGRAERGLFADRPEQTPAFAAAPLALAPGSDLAIIRGLIQEAESRRDGYDAVQHGARVKPPKPPTQMTLVEIYEWIEETPGQPHAIGRYQFIPVTLRRVAKKLGVGPQARFGPQLQDRLADVLLAEAGLHRFRDGSLSRVAFMNNLAKIWAGLPNASGRSHYHGHAGNRASISWERFEAQMARIDPAVVLAGAGGAPSP